MNPIELLDSLKQAEIRITGVANDSRDVIVGDLFLAYPGDTADGRDYIDAAIERGVAAVFWEKENFHWPEKWQHVANWPIEGLKKQVSSIAAEVYKQTDNQLHIIGVTGTNGKTSITQWLAKAIECLGEQSAVIGTLGIGKLDHLKPSRLTTPDAVTIQREMARLAKDDVRYIAMEVSSIGIEEGRVAHVPFEIAVLSNFTQDHLDYHQDMEAYWQAKEKLFYWSSLKAAVINIDDAKGLSLATQLSKTEQQVIAYSLNPDRKAHADLYCVYALSIKEAKNMQQITVSDGQKTTAIETELIGQFNVSNLLAVWVSLLAAGFEWEKIASVMGELSCVSGRMMRVLPAEMITKEQENALPTIIVDYAHTPDALKNVAATLGLYAKNMEGQLWIVFGCGGGRDNTKRLIMGAIAAELSDHVIVTDDNPRFEDAGTIRQMILSGIEDKTRVEEIGDRKEAITYAIRSASNQDVVLIAGKGHEDYQEICGVRQTFSDKQVAQDVLKERISK